MSRPNDPLHARSTFLTVGGVETHLQLTQGFALRDFCAFEVFHDENAFQELERTFLWPTAWAAARNGHGLLLDALVWRASPDYVTGLGYSLRQVDRFNRIAVARQRRSVEDFRHAHRLSAEEAPALIVCDAGPRGDGYAVGGIMAIHTAVDYHGHQLRAVAAAGVDLVCATTMTNVEESIGITRAAEKLGLPIIVSATVETDGFLPDGSSLGEWIDRVDSETSGAPLFYMVNCAHPTHVEPALRQAASAGASWLSRFRGLRANASTRSHEELDASTELDRGEPVQLAEEIAALQRNYDLRVVGGCCGTDAEHLTEIAIAVAASPDRPTLEEIGTSRPSPAELG